MILHDDNIIENLCCAFKKKQLEQIYNGSKNKDTLLSAVHIDKCFYMIIVLIKTCSVFKRHNLNNIKCVTV